MNFNGKVRVGKIDKISDGVYFLALAENHYSKKEDESWSKDWVIWYKCIAYFTPNVNVGDVVFVNGHYYSSSNEKDDYSMVVDNIGLIRPKFKKDN